MESQSIEQPCNHLTGLACPHFFVPGYGYLAIQHSSRRTTTYLIMIFISTNCSNLLQQ
ncbi:hypothetical protein DSUL_60278 [Desulfovibrionales bacterium]